MAHTGIFATAAECGSMAGELVDATGWTEANINDWCAQSESFINVATRYNYSDAYATINADFKRILSEASACLVAIHGIKYNMAGYTSRGEAELMIKVNYKRAMDCIKILSSDNAQKFMV